MQAKRQRKAAGRGEGQQAMELSQKPRDTHVPEAEGSAGPTGAGKLSKRTIEKCVLDLESGAAGDVGKSRRGGSRGAAGGQVGRRTGSGGGLTAL